MIDAPANAHALHAGTRVEEFEIVSLVGAGGFGVVYLALDHSLQRRIALKEYMPAQFASRSSDNATVTVRSSQDIETFQIGLRSFINEARLLAQFDHPALVKVYRFWQANGTAYMAMPYYVGPTLKQALANMGGPPDEGWLRSQLKPLLEACATLHAARCFHRDIAPDNILLTEAGPVLLDFGAARRVINDATRTLTVILKEGYAPIEQYGTGPSMPQGPWTDIYALCGVLRYALTGKPPPSAVERLMADHMEPLRGLYSGSYSEGLLRAIDAGLAIKPAERPQDIAQFKRLLDSWESDTTRIRSPARREKGSTSTNDLETAPPETGNWPNANEAAADFDLPRTNRGAQPVALERDNKWHQGSEESGRAIEKTTLKPVLLRDSPSAEKWIVPVTVIAAQP
jgi:serine/threonine protein kinase